MWLLQHPDQLQPTHYTQHPSSIGSAGQQLQGPISGGRIDYIFLSDDLIDAGWLQSTLQHRRFPSDHRPVLASLQPPDTPDLGKARWRFPNHLLGVEAFKEQYRSKLQEAITELDQRSSPLDPAEKWECIKQQAQDLCKHLQHLLKQQQQQERQRLWQQVNAAKRQQRRLQDTESVRQQNAAEDALGAFERAQLTQQTAATESLWELYGEQSTYWFHRLGRAAQEPQLIAEVQRPDGMHGGAQGREGVAAVGELLADFYDPATGGLFSRHPTDPQQQQDACWQQWINSSTTRSSSSAAGTGEDGTITAAEAQAALRSLPRGKSPGSDGLTYEFYTAMWEVVGVPLVAAFNYCFQPAAPRLSERQRLGLITLIYKGGGKPRADPASYRPITLLNCDLKIVAKVLVRGSGQHAPAS